MDSQLSKLCLDSLADSIINSPPVIQEMIIDSSKKAIKKQVKKEVKSSVTQSTCNIFSWLLPEIIQILNNESNGSSYFYFDRNVIMRKYSDVDNFIVETCIDISETILSNIQIQNFSQYTRDELSDYEGDY